MKVFFLNKAHWMVGCIGLALVSAGWASDLPRDPYTHFFDETFGDYRDELARAAEEGKRGVFLFLEMDDCPYCILMKRRVLNRPVVQEWYRERFLNFAVDLEGSTEVVDFSGKPMAAGEFGKQFNRRAFTPVLVFIGLDGQLQHRHFGPAKTPQEMIWLGEFVVNGDYRSTSFSRYKRERKDARRDVDAGP